MSQEVLVIHREDQVMQMEVASQGLQITRSGGGDRLRPTDLLLGALGSCMLGTMLNYADHRNIGIDSAQVSLRPISTLSPVRLAKIRVRLAVSGTFDDAQLEELKQKMRSCKIHESLSRGVATEVEVVDQQVAS